MRRTPIIAAAIGSLLASSAFAGFTVTATLNTSVAGFDRYDIRAVNDGVDTGTQVSGLEYTYNGALVSFEVADLTDATGAAGGDPGDPDGVPDTTNFNSLTRSRIRVSGTAGNNTYVGVTPPGTAQPNAYVPGLTQFSGAIANTGTTNATGTGFEIARLFLPTGGTGVFSGNIGGNIGNKVPFSVTLGGGGNANPSIASIPVTNVVFGQIVTNGAPFSVQVNVTDPNAADVLSLALGSLPATVSGVTITGANGVSPRSFTVSGTVDYSANGTDVSIPVIASDGAGGTANANIVLHVTPEPASLGLFGLSTLLLGRRRK